VRCGLLGCKVDWHGPHSFSCQPISLPCVRAFVITHQSESRALKEAYLTGREQMSRAASSSRAVAWAAGAGRAVAMASLVLAFAWCSLGEGLLCLVDSRYFVLEKQWRCQPRGRKPSRAGLEVCTPEVPCCARHAACPWCLSSFHNQPPSMSPRAVRFLRWYTTVFEVGCSRAEASHKWPESATGCRSLACTREPAPWKRNLPFTTHAHCNCASCRPALCALAQPCTNPSPVAATWSAGAAAAAPIQMRSPPSLCAAGLSALLLVLACSPLPVVRAVCCYPRCYGTPDGSTAFWICADATHPDPELLTSGQCGNCLTVPGGACTNEPPCNPFG